jgi:tetratricopeptide (TPR) repeat protein
VIQALERRAAAMTGLALDDLHFADDASLQLLPSLIDSGLALALAARGGELPRPLAEWRDAAGGEALTEIALLPLREADVRSLLESLQLDGIDAQALAAPLALHSGGNPFFVLETLGALIAHPDQQIGQLPSTPAVGALIERRLGQLSPAALRLARVGALAGPDFDAALAAHVLQQHPLDLAEAWSELERAHVLREHGLAHDLVRDAIARSVPLPIAQWLHRGIAEYLEGHAGAPARTAHHYEQAQLWPQAARFYLHAGDDARRASRRAEELSQRDAAAACLDRAGDADAAFDARSAAIEPALLVRGVDQARQRVLQLVANARTDVQKANAMTAHANVALMAGDHVTGVATAREALALADRLAQPWLQFQASRLLAVGLSQQGAAEEAEAVLTPFEAQVVADGSIEQRGHYYADLAYVLNSARRLRRTADALERASACARELGDLAELATLTTNLATVHGNLGHSEAALEHAQRARALQVELGESGGPTGGVIEAHVGLYAAALGQYDTALQSFERAINVFQRDGQALWVAVCSNNLAAVYIELGQFARARKALDYVPPNVAHVAARGALLAARLARALGSSPAHDLQRAADALGRTPDFYVGAQLEIERAELLAPAEAVPLFDTVSRDADAREYGGVALKARLLAARAALQAGDAASAATRWAELERLRITLHPTDCYPPLLDAVGRDILLARRDHPGAARLLAAGVRWIRETALPHVPEAFRDTFQHRNPVNRALLTAASRTR